MSSTLAKNILILSLGLGLAIATPVPQTSTSDVQQTMTNGTTMANPSLAEMETLRIITPVGAECFLMGNPAYYPLGLRLGIYLQWFATIFANFFVPSVARQMRGINTLFQLGVFCGLSYAVTNMAALDGIEGFILLTLCIGSITALITSPNMDIRVTRVGSIARLSIFLAVFIFGAWYWFIGMNYMAKTACTQQIQFLFFWKVHLYHWFQKFSEAVMVIGSIAISVALGWELFGLFTVFRSQGAKSTSWAIIEGKLHKDSFLGGILQQEKYAWISGALLVILTVAMAAFVVTVEGALKYSNTYYVFDLESPAELIPFVIGMFSVGNVVVGMFMGTMDVVNKARSMSPVEKELGSRPSTGRPDIEV